MSLLVLRQYSSCQPWFLAFQQVAVGIPAHRTGPPGDGVFCPDAIDSLSLCALGEVFLGHRKGYVSVCQGLAPAQIMG